MTRLSVYPDGTRRWSLNGCLHRDDGPAVEYADGTKVWYESLVGGWQLHRSGGPAIEWTDGRRSWYEHGSLVRKEGWWS